MKTQPRQTCQAWHTGRDKELKKTGQSAVGLQRPVLVLAGSEAAALPPSVMVQVSNQGPRVREPGSSGILLTALEKGGCLFGSHWKLRVLLCSL